MNEHANRCILRDPCKLAGTDACNRMCSSYIAMHGFDGAGGRIAAANVPPEYRQLTVKTSPAREGQADIYRFIDEYITTFSEDARITSLYLYSEAPGTGKTTTAAAVLNEYIIASYISALKRKEKPPERPAFYLAVNDWQTDYNAFNRPRVPEEVAAPHAERYYRMMHIAAKVPFLVADDIGVREATPAFRADLHTIIEHRASNGLPTVYTSNISMSETLRLFDARIADRIRDMCADLHFAGGSKRGMR